MRIPFCSTNGESWFIKAEPRSDKPEGYPVLATEENIGIKSGLVEVVFPNERTLHMYANNERGRDEMRNDYYGGGFLPIANI